MTHPFDGRGRITIAMGEDGVAQVRLARADKLNALDPAMFAAITDAGHHLASLRGLRAVVLAGEGRAFCAGLDLATMQGLLAPDAAPLAERSHGDANLFQHVALVWRKLPVPVIAAIHGACLGGGLQIAAGADIRVVAPDARLAVMETRWGIVPDMGHFALWRGHVREDVLRELTYTHREFSGREAAELGFATHVDADPLARASAIAAAIAAISPHAIRTGKGLFNHTQRLGESEILLAESIEQQKLVGSRNQIEAVRAGMAGERPDFTDP